VIDLRCGDWVEVLRTLPDESVNCVVTSPPYFGLRDYGTAKWEGGDVSCNHAKKSGGERGETLEGGDQRGRSEYPYPDICRKCGAIRIDAQLGLEKTPEEYVAKMVAGFREVRRVLRKDATLWLNLGDSFAGSGKAAGQTDESTNFGKAKSLRTYDVASRTITPIGLKPKDLCGIPWRVAFALQADGWWLRSDIIWAKPNPMPESVHDRPTKSHEYVFLMSKSAKYYYDFDAIKEPASYNTHERQARAKDEHKSAPDADRNGIRSMRKPSGWDTTVGDGGHSSFHKDGRRKLAEPGEGIKNNSSFDDAMAIMPDSRNKRSVWTIATQAMKEAHFATFPEKLVEPCVLAGCPEGGTVLDPFAGTCTVGLVAARLNRSFIGIDLNPEYLKMRKKQIDAIVRQERMAV